MRIVRRLVGRAELRVRQKPLPLTSKDQMKLPIDATNRT